MTETDALNPDMTLQRVAPLRGEELAALVEAGMPAEANLRMEVTLVPPRPADPFLRIGLRIGDRKWFVVRDLPAFLRAWRSRTPLTFQSRLISKGVI